MRESTPQISLAARLMPAVMRLRRANRNYRTREDVRRHLKELRLRPQSDSPPARLRRGVAVTVGRDREWRIYIVSPAQGEVRGTVIYLHGGGWMHEAAGAHWRWVQRLADEASVEVLMPVYPLAQEGGTAETVVPRIAELCEDAGRPVVLMGDSAGGSIAMSAALALPARQVTVALTVLVSPALDLRFTNPEIDAVQPSDPWLVKKGQLEVSEMWIGDHSEDPILNPFLGELEGIGRLMIFSGTRDILNPDTRLFVDRARAAGVDVEFHEQPGHLHVYPLLPTPEGRRARRRMVESVREVTGSVVG